MSELNYNFSQTAIAFWQGASDAVACVTKLSSFIEDHVHDGTWSSAYCSAAYFSEHLEKAATGLVACEFYPDGVFDYDVAETLGAWWATGQGFGLDDHQMDELMAVKTWTILNKEFRPDPDSGADLLTSFLRKLDELVPGVHEAKKRLLDGERKALFQVLLEDNCPPLVPRVLSPSFLELGAAEVEVIDCDDESVRMTVNLPEQRAGRERFDRAWLLLCNKVSRRKAETREWVYPIPEAGEPEVKRPKPGSKPEPKPVAIDKYADNPTAGAW